MSLCIGLSTILGTITTVAVGAATPDDIKTYVALNNDPWDNNTQLNFMEPMGSFGIEYDVNPNIRLFGEHLSSPRQCNDHPGVNHAGVKFMMPLGDTTLYNGWSLNNSSFDSNDNFDSPLMSIGAEWGDDLRFYVEYLTGISDFDGGRASTGIKVLFR